MYNFLIISIQESSTNLIKLKKNEIKPYFDLLLFHFFLNTST